MGKIPILSPSIPSAQFSSTLRITVRMSSCKTERKDAFQDGVNEERLSSSRTQTLKGNNEAGTILH